MKRSASLLFIEPKRWATHDAIVDTITRKMCGAFRAARQSEHAYGGIHVCFCGACSSNCNYYLPSGEMTNSLCVHYVAHHREEVPLEALAAIDRFRCREADPNELKFQGRAYVLRCSWSSIERKLGLDRLSAWVSWGLDADALARDRVGGSLPAPEFLTPARRDADDLFSILYAIPPEAFPYVERAAIPSRGNLDAWKSDALCIPGWKRTAWVAPLTEILSLPGDALPGNEQVRRALTYLRSELLDGQRHKPLT
jgi:hypothetical protein